MLRKVLQISLTLLLFISMLWLGQQRKYFDKYFATRYHTHSYFWYTPDRYTTHFGKLVQNIYTDYKWLSSFTYSGLYFLISVCIVYTLFNSTKVVMHHILFLFIILMVIGGSILVSVATGSYEWGYVPAQHLKKFFQSPLPTFCTIIYYWKIKKP